ncbi:MAG: DNA recombination protein RmuC [Planctomycetes bacterium]|nr:DNA recombination protein RmuC [Planctomycetota bacterium]
MEYLFAALALFFGVLVGWLIATQRANRTQEALRAESASAEATLARLEAQLAERTIALEDQRRFLTESREQFQNAFARLSQEAIDRNSKSLLDATNERLAPVKSALEKLESKSLEIEKSRAQAYGSLEKHLTDLSLITVSLRSSNDVLVTAFKGSMTARGRFGEIGLRNLVDSAGMLVHCDFLEQIVIEDGARPDMIIRLPEGDGIPVDAKLPLSAYWAAAEAGDPDERKRALKEHAELVRRQVRALAKRDYASLVSGRIDYAVLFLPADPILSYAYEAAPDLFDEAMRLRVLIATPVTLIAILRSTKVLWNQRALADNAIAIQKEAGEMYKRVVKYQEYVAAIGTGLERATGAYNLAARSFQTRVLPAGRRVEELGGANEVSEKLAELREVEIVPVVREEGQGEKRPEEDAGAESKTEQETGT